MKKEIRIIIDNNTLYLIHENGVETFTTYSEMPFAAEEFINHMFFEQPGIEEE